MSETLLEQAAAFVEPATKPASGKVAASASRFRVGRAIKIGLASALLIGAAGALVVGQSRVTTDNAVVSAYVLSVRSPIQGQVSGLQLRVGDTVQGTDLLGRVVNDRVSDEHLVDLRSEVVRNKAERAALESQRQALTTLRATLVVRSDEYRAAQTAYAAASSNEAEAQLVGGALRLDLARRAMARKVALGHFGDAPVADVDTATIEARTAEADVTSRAAHLAYLRARQAAVAQGLYLDAGGNDVSYSTQRIDEIDLRLADVNRTSAELAAKAAATDIRLAAEEHRFETLSRADLELLASGMVWKLGASNGERIGIGDTLAQVIDCGAAFIVAAIPQRQFSAVEVGSIAQFRLSGETTDRTGRVLSVTGDSSVAIDRNLAATPVADPATTAVVRVEVPPSGNNGAACLVGRTARVLLPRAGDGMLAWLSKWVP
jgi:multidrug resistance efflux pump